MGARTFNDLPSAPINDISPGIYNGGNDGNLFWIARVFVVRFNPNAQEITFCVERSGGIQHKELTK